MLPVSSGSEPAFWLGIVRPSARLSFINRQILVDLAGGAEKAGSKRAAILATADRVSLIATGATEQTRNRRLSRLAERGGSISARASGLLPSYRVVILGGGSNAAWGWRKWNLLQLYPKTQAPPHCPCGGVVFCRAGPDCPEALYETWQRLRVGDISLPLG